MNETFFIIVFSFSVIAAHASDKDWKEDFNHPAIDGPFTKTTNDAVDSFNFADIPPDLKTNGKITLQCFFDDSKKMAIGVLQNMVVNSPLNSVETIVKNIDNYKNIFHGYHDIKILEKQEPRWLTYWEQSVPWPFSNIKYRLMYTVSEKEKRQRLRYQLTFSRDVIYSDGLILLEADADPNKTRYFEIDFWDVKSGLGSSMAPSAIRRESIEAVYLSDRAVQLRAEKPDLEDKKIRELAKKEMDKATIEKCLASKDKFQPFWLKRTPADNR